MEASANPANYIFCANIRLVTWSDSQGKGTRIVSNQGRSSMDAHNNSKEAGTDRGSVMLSLTVIEIYLH